jgi:hypothetical protein
MFRVFSHLQHHKESGIFYFWLAVPAHLRDHIGRSEIKKSLGPGLRSEATLKAQKLFVETMEMFHRLEMKRMAPTKPKRRPVAPAVDPWAGLDNPSAPRMLEKITLTIGGNKVTIEHENPAKEVDLVAVRAGIKKAWQERDYAVIVAVADKIPNNVLEEDPKLLMWYDQAVTRMGGLETSNEYELRR